MTRPRSASLRAAIVGCGRIGTCTSPATLAGLPPGWAPLNHAAAARAAGLELVAFCDPDASHLARAGELFGVEALYRDAGEMLVGTAPDIVGLATRTLGRTDLLRAAVAAGVRGIHVEKPISRSLADARDALRAAAAKNVALTYGTTRRFMKAYRLARDLVRAGAIGDLIEIDVAHGLASLLWTHPHSTDLLVFFAECREVDHVQATCRIAGQVRENVLDEDPLVEQATVRFANGILGHIGASGGMHTTLGGSRGSLTVACDGSWLELRKPAGAYLAWPEKVEILPAASGTQTAFAELSAAVAGREPLLSIAPGEIELSHALLFAFVASSLKEGRRIRLQDVDPEFTVTGRSGDLYA